MIPKMAPKSTALTVNSGRFARSLIYGRNSPIGAVEFQFGFVGSVFDIRGTYHRFVPAGLPEAPEFTTLSGRETLTRRAGSRAALARLCRRPARPARQPA